MRWASCSNGPRQSMSTPKTSGVHFGLDIGSSAAELTVGGKL